MFALKLALLALAVVPSEPLSRGDHFRHLEVDQQKRTYWIHVPPSYDAAKPTAVVLALHGATMSAKGMEALTGLSQKADREGFIVVYPNGAGSPFLQTWNSGGFTPFLSQSKPNDVRFTAKVLDDLKPARLDYRFTIYPGQNHNSVRLVSFPAGLYWVYRPAK